MLKKNWEKLCDTDVFETRSLLDAVDSIDQWRHRLADIKHADKGVSVPAKVRTDTLDLHELAMSVVNHGSRAKADALCARALELSDEIQDILDHLQNAHDKLFRLASFGFDEVVADEDGDDLLEEEEDTGEARGRAS